MRTGSQITATFPVGATVDEQVRREALILSAIQNREVPEYLGNLWVPILVEAPDKNGATHRLVLHVSPRYVEIGSNEDPFLAPMWPFTAQKVADLFNAILPSKKIVDYIWDQAEKKLPIGPPKGFSIPGPDMDQTPSWVSHNTVIQGLMGDSIGLMAGGKKDVVIGPDLDGAKVAIYSTPFWPDGPRQLYSTIHHSKYSDYSHGIRLVNKIAELDGKEVLLESIFSDPILSTLVSDQGAFSPVFPNIGTGTTVSYGLTKQTSAGGAPAVDPTVPVASLVELESRPNGLLIGGGIGLVASLMLGFGIPATVAVTVIGAIIGRTKE